MTGICGQIFADKTESDEILKERGVRRNGSCGSNYNYYLIFKTPFRKSEIKSELENQKIFTIKRSVRKYRASNKTLFKDKKRDEEIGGTNRSWSNTKTN